MRGLCARVYVLTSFLWSSSWIYALLICMVLMEIGNYSGTFFKLDCLRCNNLIFGGDLNYIVGFSEIWGAKERVDSLSDYFTRLMDGFGLVDIVPAVILPT